MVRALFRENGRYSSHLEIQIYFVNLINKCSHNHQGVCNEITVIILFSSCSVFHVFGRACTGSEDKNHQENNGKQLHRRLLHERVEDRQGFGYEGLLADERLQDCWQRMLQHAKIRKNVILKIDRENGLLCPAQERRSKS